LRCANLNQIEAFYSNRKYKIKRKRKTRQNAMLSVLLKVRTLKTGDLIKSTKILLRSETDTKSANV
jgi:hypothetical protein